MMFGLLMILQAVQVAILWLHDWIPLPPLNDVAAVRAAEPTGRLVMATVLQSLPYTLGLAFSAGGLAGHVAGWVWAWLWISYGLLFAGELSAWWLPYFARRDPDKAARYREMFGATHAFLPERNGIRPNTLHVVLHGCTAATLMTLAALAR